MASCHGLEEPRRAPPATATSASSLHSASTAGDTLRSDLHRALPLTSASTSHGHERHQQQVQAIPPSPSPPSCTSSPVLSVGAMPLGARSRVAGVPPQRCRLEPPPCAKSRHGHHLPDALAAARPPRCHQGVPWPPPRTLESARPHGRSNDYTLKRQVPRQYVYDYRRREDREFNYFHNASCTTTVAWVRQDVEYHYVGQVHLRQDRCPNKHRLHGLRQVPLPTTPNIYGVYTIARCEPLLLIPSPCTTTSSTNLIRSEKSRLEASVSFRSCEDSFDYVRLSSSWTRSSSLRDLRQDDHTLEITSIFAC
ncbi:uncharacterized protein [Aegilops tauschii subsp. strangulata]|uniref:uncharacterized protein n=1 Tax=Aegilops tauschii subsp. strangulata TaxID=200361 RepID=UPI003CC8BEB0